MPVLAAGARIAPAAHARPATPASTPPKTPAQRTQSGQVVPAATYGNRPLAFEPNQGQADPSVLYLAHGPGYTLLLTRSGAILQLDRRVRAKGSRHPEIAAAGSITLQAIGGDPAARLSAGHQLVGTVNYDIGADPQRWLSAIPTYAEVTYRGIYPGVDLTFHSRNGQLEYDFVLAPGVDPGLVSVGISGADRLQLDRHGSLLIHAGGITLVQEPPGVSIGSGTARYAASGGYVLTGNDRVSFQVGRHDRLQSITIDPVLVFASSISDGTGSLGQDVVTGIGVDAAGNTYVSGYSWAGVVPLSGANAFLSKLSPTGAVLSTTFFGGSSPTRADAIAVDAAGNAYLAGQTESIDFPTTTGAYQTALTVATCTLPCPEPNAFLTKFTPSGAIAYSTYYGAPGYVANGIAIDSGGNAYIAGTTAAVSPRHGFLARLDPSASPGSAQLVASTVLGGNGDSWFNAVAVNANGAYLTGGTMATDLATTGAAQTTAGGGTDAFVAQWAGAGFAYLTYAGGGGDDEGNAIALDSAGNAYVTGATHSTNFPTTTGAFQATSGGGSTDAFVTKVSSDGSHFVYSTYLGGSGDDSGLAIAVDPSNHAIVAGTTSSSNFPVHNSLQGYGGGLDMFVTRLFEGGASIVYSTYYGGTNDEQATGLALGLTTSGTGWNDAGVDQAVYVVGTTSSHLTDTVSVSGLVLKLAMVHPDTRANYAMAYDSRRGVTVMFGGYNASVVEGSNFLNDTWEYSGGFWTKVTTAHVPFPRYDASMVYSAAENRIILFGGWVPCGSAIICPAGDTWAYDGTDWTPLTSGISPPARAAFGMAYDSGRQRIVLFGGVGINGVLLNDTWEWNGTGWTQTLAGSPPVSTPGTCQSSSLPDPRGWFSLAYDSARSRTVLFSGTTGSCDFADTWEYDGASWSNVSLPTSPSPRGNYAMVYSPASGATVVSGGCLAGTVFNDTWEWTGTSWINRTETYGSRLGARFNIAAAYDSARQKMVLFGGNMGTGCPPIAAAPLSDTWELSFPATTPPPPPPPPPPAATNLSLTVDESIIPAGTAVAALSSVPAGRMPAILGAPAASPVGSIPVGSIPVGSIPVGSIPVGSIPVGSIPVGSIPVGSIDIGSSPVGSIPVGSIGLDASGTSPLANVLLSALPSVDWNGSILVGTTLAGLPLQTLTLKDVQNYTDANGVHVAWDRFSHLLLKDTGIGSTLLRNTTLASILLGGATLSSLPIPEPQPDWCAEFKAHNPTFSCDPGTIGNTTMLGEDIAGAPVGSIPVGSIPVGSIPVGSIPVGSIPVGSINLVATPVGSIPVGSIPVPGQVVDCVRIDCTPAGGKTVGDAAALVPSAILPNATLAMLGPTIANIPLGQLIAGLVPLGSLSWEKLAIDGLQDFAPQTPAGLHYHVNLDLNCATTQSLSVRVSLPNGFRYIPNSSQVIFGSRPSQALAEPIGAQPPLTDTPDVLTWNAFPPDPCVGQGASGSEHVVVNFRAQPGLDLGTYAASASVSTPGTLTTQNQAPVTVTENFEPNSTPATAPIIQPDQLILSHIATEGNTDYYRLAIPAPGTRVTFFLSHIAAGSDFDLVIGKPATASLIAAPVGSIPVGSIPIEDRGIGTGNATSALPAETLQDLSLNGIPVGSIPVGSIPVGSITVASVSQNRGNADEVAQVVTGTETGFYTIQVTGYNGSTSVRPYVLRVRESAPVALNCPALVLPTSGTVGALPAPGSLPSGTQTLFLINQSRMANLYAQPDVNSVLATLGTLTGRADVKGAVIPIDGSAAVRTAYAAWDAAPCDIGKANAVVAAINTVVASYRAVLHGLRYLVIVGSDQAIPMARVPDLTTISNESNEARDLDFLLNGGTQAGALYAAEALGFSMTDDAYTAQTITPWLGHELYLPTISSGRLIETPHEIIGQLSQFAGAGGVLNPSSAFTSGYDFLSGGATSIANSMADRYGAGNSSSLISSSWNASDILGRYFDAATVPGIDSPNAHYSHYLLEPAAASANGVFTTSDLVSTSAVASLAAGSLAGRIIFTMGCHGGLNIPDTLLPPPPPGQQLDPRLLDWVQAYSQQQVAVYVANTGYGYGDTLAVALSVRLMSLFGQELTAQDGLSIGEKMVTSKHAYFDNMGAYGVYDEKALEEATFYGLPMYHLANGGTTPPPTFVAPTGTDPATGLPTLNLSVSPTQGGPNPSLTLHSTPFGNYYSGPAGTLDTFYRPLEPLFSQDVTIAGSRAHGVMVTGLQTTDVSGFTPALARPTIDLSGHEPPPGFVDNLFPANFVRLDRSNAFGNDRQRFVLVAGQYRPNQDPTTGGTERLITNINASVIYSTSNNFVPPLIALVNSVWNGGNAAAVNVEVRDAAGVSRVTVLALDRNGWHALDLTPTAGTTLWTGTVTGLADNPQLFVQAEDAVGNVAYSTSKGFLFVASPASADTTPPTTTLVPQVAAGGASVTISSATLTPQGGQPQQFGPLTCWSSGTPTVQLQAIDNPGGSGVKQVSYALSGAQSKPLTSVIGSAATVKFTAPGTTTLTFHATDFAGNAEADQRAKVFIAGQLACVPAVIIASLPAHGMLAVSGSITLPTPSGPVTTPFSFSLTF